MPNIISRKSVRGPSVAPAASSGSAIAQGLAQVGGALLGQAAEQQFQAEQFEIKQQERTQVMQAQSAVIDKQNARIVAREDIRKNFEPTQYIDELDKWEDNYDEVQNKEQSQFFTESFAQRDFINRVNSAGRMGTAMRSDLLNDTKDGLETMLGNASTAPDVEDIKQWALEDGVMSTDFIDKKTNDKRFQLNRDRLLEMPVTEAIESIHSDDFAGLTVDERNDLQTAVMNQNRMDVAVESLNNGLADYEVTRTVNEMAQGGATYAEAQAFVNTIDEDSAQRTTAQNLVNKKYSESLEKSSFTAKQLTANAKNVRNAVFADISLAKALVNKKGFDPGDDESISKLGAFSDSLSASAKDLEEKADRGEITPADRDDIMFHIDATLKSMGTRTEDGRAGWIFFRFDTKSISGIASDVLLNINVAGSPNQMSIDDEAVYTRSVMSQVGEIEDRYVNKKLTDQNSIWSNIDRIAREEVAVSRGITSEKGKAEFITQVENTNPGDRTTVHINNILETATKNNISLTVEDATALADRRNIPTNHRDSFISFLVSETQENSQ